MDAVTPGNDGPYNPNIGVLDNILKLLQRHLYVSPESYVAIALWILLSHASDYFHYRPRLAISSPARGCGKTTVLRLIDLVARDTLFASNISSAALYRIVAAQQPTLLIDEADSFLGGNDQLRGIINAGFERNGKIIRCVGDSFTPKEFPCSSPMAIAAIGHLPSTIVDRSIVINMERKPVDHKLERLDSLNSQPFDEIAERCCVWVNAHADQIKGHRPDLPELGSDRAMDCWHPLITIADLAGERWGIWARKSALTLTDESHLAMSEDWGLLLLRDIHTIAIDGTDDRISSAMLCDALAEMEDRPWPDSNYGRPITPPQLARLLAPFGIKPTTIRLSSQQTPKGYMFRFFKEAWDRYLD